jgi:hypothetical protein
MYQVRPFALIISLAVVFVAAGSAFWKAELAVGPQAPPASGVPSGDVPAPVLPATSTTSGTPAVTPKPSVTPPAPIPAPTPSGYTMTQVRQHASAASCWSAVNGSVYDLTSWINQHPGGSEAILGLCGRDGSATFNDQHGGQRRPANELAGFRIGALVN